MQSYKNFSALGVCFLALFVFAVDGYSFTCPNPPVKLGSTGSYYNTIMSAYGAAANGDVIKLEANPFEEDLDFSSSKAIVLDGGYDDCSFSSNSLTTEITGSLTISGGTVTASKIVLTSPQVIADADGDGYFGTGSCGGPADDCDDNNASIHPGAVDIPYDGIDQDCNGVDLTFSDASPCSSCHGIPLNQWAAVHANVPTPDGTCAPCHTAPVGNMLSGHYGDTVRTAGNNMTAGSIIRCVSCHDQDSFEHPGGPNIVMAKVFAAWQNNSLSCDTCHETRAADHDTATAHDNRTIETSCGQCHGTLATQADIDTLHRNDCALCHAYTGTKICADTVRQVIEDGLNGTPASCLDCHAAHHSPETNNVSYNASVDTSQSSRQGCAECHYDYDIVNASSVGLSIWDAILFEHDLDGTKDGSANACSTCHDSSHQTVQNVIASGNPATCANCHTDKVPDVDHGVPTTGKHPEHLAMAGISTCSTCHASIPYFQSGTDTNNDGLYNLAETDVCNPCHQDWDSAGLPAGQDYKTGWFDTAFSLECNDCHAEVVDNGDNIPASGRRAVTGEFPLSEAHAHYGSILDSTSCQVCHDHANHAFGTIDLLDPDGGANYSFVVPTDLTSDPDLSNFCSNCHDADGATRLATPLDPFANGNVSPDVASRFMGTLQWNEYYGDSCFGYEGSQRPVNSHHDISDTDQAISGAKIECLDCHGAHTSAASQKLTDPFADNVAWTGTLNQFCLSCHNGDHGPNDPTLPADVMTPTFYTPPPADNIPGKSCGVGMVYDCSGVCLTQIEIDAALNNENCDDIPSPDLDCTMFNFDNGECAPVNAPNTSCGPEMIYDCSDNCVAQVDVDAALINGLCDETIDLDLSCAEFNYDYYICQPCVGNDCTFLGGVDSCNYYTAPWHIEVTWSNEAHGGGSKRQWGGYSGAPEVPAMDCVACHDSHGSYDATTNTGGNPYMLRDYVDGTQFVDDGIRTSAQWTGPPWETTGTAGSVVINGFDGGTIGPQIGDQLCVKCHANWAAAYSWHSMCTGCLSCHSHGQAWGATDFGNQGVDEATFCPK